MKVIRYLILVVTTRCNLQCRYCYNGEICYTTDMPENILRQALEIVGEGKSPIHIQITGGEPALVPNKIDVILESVRKKLARPYTVGIQTNGTLISPDLAKKFKMYGVQVGISLDGPPGINEVLRGKTGATLRGMAILEHYRVPFWITTVVTAQNLPFLDKLAYMLAGFKEVKGIGLDLLVRKGRAFSSSEIALPEPNELRKSVKSFLMALDEINRRRSVPIVLREREKLKKALAGFRQSFFCHASKGESMAVMPDGSIFPCGQTAGDPKFFAGTVWNFDREKLGSLGSFRVSESVCKDCSLEKVCPGDCPSRVTYNGQDANLICSIYRVISEVMSQKGSFK